MKRLVRLLVLTAGAVVLFHGPRTVTVEAQNIYELSCVASIYTMPAPYCDSCCSNGTQWVDETLTADAVCGHQTSFPQGGHGDCGTLRTGCPNTITCGTFDYPAPGYDPTCRSCFGEPCQNNLDCAGGWTCVAGSCCDPNFGQECGYCGRIRCDGSCNDPCTSLSCPDGACYDDSDCNSGYYCSDNCCTSSGGGGGGGGDGGDGGDPCGGCPDGYICEGIYYSYLHDYIYECYYYMDPVIVDLDGSGYTLSDAQHGVSFDFFGDGKPRKAAWPSAGSNVGWLVLDRDADGHIDNGFEMFSNLTPQPGRAAAHLGFKALALFDQPQYGGNADGWIDSRDAVYARLRVWVDKNHNGISEPAELLTLQTAGITAISTKYLKNNWTDSYGNQFQYKTQITRVSQGQGNGKGQGDGGGRDQWIYDVVLLSAPLR